MTATQKVRKDFEFPFDSEPNQRNIGTSIMAHKNKTNYSAYKARQNQKKGPPATAKTGALTGSLSGDLPSKKTATKPGVNHPAKPAPKLGARKAEPVKEKPKPFDQTSYKLLGKHKRPDDIFSLEEANDRLYDVFKNHNFDECISIQCFVFIRS